jgi:hypothetical protein
MVGGPRLKEKYGPAGKKRGREGDGRRRDWAERKGEGFRFFLFFSKPFQTSNSFQSLNTFKTFQD